MKGLRISDNEIVRRISNKGGVDRHTLCPYCGHTISFACDSVFCGHVVNRWEADGRQYVLFSQFQQKYMPNLIAKACEDIKKSGKLYTYDEIFPRKLN